MLRTSLALASVVTIFSCLSRAVTRLRYNAWRWPESRLKLLPVTLCLISMVLRAAIIPYQLFFQQYFLPSSFCLCLWVWFLPPPRFSLRFLDLAIARLMKGGLRFPDRISARNYVT